MNIDQHNVPKLRFPEFEGNWEYDKLNQWLQESKKRNTKLHFDKSDVLSVSGELGVVNQIEHLGRSYAGESVHNYHVVENGDVVYTKSPLKNAPYGIIKSNKGNAGIVSTLYAVYKVIHEKALGNFFDYYFSLDDNLNSYLRPLVKKGAKNDMKVNNAHVLTDKISVPSLPEQQKVASFLTAVDARIGLLVKKKALLEQYKKGVMQQLFSQQIRFKDEEGNAFPDWKILKLEEAATINPKTKELPQSFVYIDLESVEKGVLIKRNIIEASNAPSRAQRLLTNNDIIFQMVRPYQKNNLFFHEGKDYVASTGYAQIRTNNDPKYIYHFLHTDKFVDEVMMRCTGTGYPAINSNDLAKINISLPSLPEQQKISTFLSAFDEKINILNLQVSKMKIWKDGLLQNMFC
ncbi:restriction endonuclease subunit S [Spirosoma daeguense]